MIKKHSFFPILFLLNSLTIFAQEKTGNVTIDSLIAILPSIKIDTVRVNTLNVIAEKFRDINPNQGIAYGDKALLLSRKIKWDDGIALSLRNIGQNNAVLGDIDAADKYFDQAFVYAKSELNKCLLYRAKGTINSSKSNYAKAIEYYFKALKMAEEIKDDKEIAKIYLVIGSSYNRIKNNKNALLYLNKSLVINTKLKSKRQICNCLNFIGHVYKDDEKYSLALDCFFKALKLSNEINSKDVFTSSNLSIAQIYMKQGKLEKALEYNTIGKEAAKEVKFYRYITSSKLNEAEIYLLQFLKDSTNSKKRFLLTKAEPLILDVIESCKKSNDNINLSTCYKSLSDLYWFQNKYKKAAETTLEYATIKDSIFSEQSKETVKNLEDQRTIDLKNKEIEINKITLEAKERQQWFYVSGIGFLCILGGLFFFQSISRKKANEKLLLLNAALNQANKSKVKFLSILNHDLRSPVYNFIHFMQLQKESPELLDAETKKTIEAKTMASAENLLGSMEDLLLWSKGQMDNFKPKPETVAVSSLFEDTKKHFESEEKTQLIFENPGNIEINTDENFLKTIIRNLTGNAIKALKSNPSPKTTATIVWKASQENNKTYLSITDNGSGASQEQFKALYDENEVVGIKTGLGLHLIRDLAKAINCEVLVESSPLKGTTFTLQIA